MTKRRFTLPLLVVVFWLAFPINARADVLVTPELSVIDVLGGPFLAIALVLAVIALVRFLIRAIAKRGGRK